MLSFGLKAVTLGVGAAVLAASASPAEARRYYRDRDNTGVAIAAGVVGLAIGAALASSSRDRYYRDRYYDGYYYDRPYYRDYPRYQYRYYDRRYSYDYDRYYYDRPYRHYRQRCVTRRVYDPYLDRRVRVRYCR